MPKGKPKAGFRKTEKFKSRTLRELEQDIASKAPGFIEELEKYIKPFPCPHCGNEIQVIDKEVAMYMVDRALGKPKQRTELGITETIQLNADQIDELIEKHLDPFMALIAGRYLALFVERYQTDIRALITQGEVIEGEVEEIINE
jgi:hypothetical protein